MKKYLVKAVSKCNLIFKGHLYSNGVEFELEMNEKQIEFYKDFMEIVNKKENKEKLPPKTNTKTKQETTKDKGDE